MSASKFVLLECDALRAPDGGKCLEWWQARRSGTSVREARQAARGEGWRYRTSHPAAGPAMDLCPTHAALAGSADDTTRGATS